MGAVYFLHSSIIALARIALLLCPLKFVYELIQIAATHKNKQTVKKIDYNRFISVSGDIQIYDIGILPSLLLSKNSDLKLLHEV